MSGFWDKLIVTTTLQAFLYGLYVILFGLCIVILERRKNDVNRVRHLASVTTLFVLVTGGFVFSLVGAVNGSHLRENLMENELTHEDVEKFGKQAFATVLLSLIFLMVQNFISELILWRRLRMIWEQRLMLIISAFMILANNTVALVCIVLLARNGSTGMLQLSLFAAVDTGPFPRNSFVPFVVTLVVLSGGTNCLLPGLIAGRIWYLQREQRKRSRLRSSSAQKINQIVVIMLESAVMFPMALALWLILFLAKTGPPEIIFRLLPYINAIAATLIFVRAGLKSAGNDSVDYPSFPSSRPTYSSDFPSPRPTYSSDLPSPRPTYEFPSVRPMFSSEWITTK